MCSIVNVAWVVKQVISYDSARGGVSVVTEKGAATTSYLLVQDAAPSDSGRYSCAPSNADLASVRVHVLNGEKTQTYSLIFYHHKLRVFLLCFKIEVQMVL